MDLNNRWFNGQPVHSELSPVTDFREACCRQYEMGSVSISLSDEYLYTTVFDSQCTCNNNQMPCFTTAFHHIFTVPPCNQ